MDNLVIIRGFLFYKISKSMKLFYAVYPRINYYRLIINYYLYHSHETESKAAFAEKAKGKQY